MLTKDAPTTETTDQGEVNKLDYTTRIRLSRLGCLLENDSAEAEAMDLPNTKDEDEESNGPPGLTEDDKSDDDVGDAQERAGEVGQQVHPGSCLENQLRRADGLAHVPGC